MNDNRTEDLKMLRLREQICLACIKILEGITDDPRQPDALKGYQRQLESIRGKIKTAVENQPIPPVTVKLNTAVLRLRAKE